MHCMISVDFHLLDDHFVTISYVTTTPYNTPLYRLYRISTDRDVVEVMVMEVTVCTVCMEAVASIIACYFKCSCSSKCMAEGSLILSSALNWLVLLHNFCLLSPSLFSYSSSS